MTGKSILVSANLAWNLVNFRRPVIAALVAAGHKVVAAAPPGAGMERALSDLGCSFVPLPMKSRSLSPIGDARLWLSYDRLMRQLRPDAYLSWTIKPNIYGTLAASRLGLPAIVNVSGLGTAILAGGPVSHAALQLYRLALPRASRVFVQNASDADFLTEKKRIVAADKLARLPGSGIDLAAYRPTPLPSEAPSAAFLMIARLIRDKGVVEFVEAARTVKKRYPATRFRIVGATWADNRSAISDESLARWRAEGLVDFHEPVSDVRPLIAEADCVVLPSYREGLSRVLLEGAACGRPLIASDVPGCREMIADGVNGFLCAPRSAESLAGSIEKFVAKDAADRQRMGKASRALVEAHYGEELVIDAYRQALRPHDIRF